MLKLNSQKVWGIYDTIDKCWIGPENSLPLTFDDHEECRIACDIVTQNFGFPSNRIIPQPYDSNGLRYKDHITTKKPPTLRIVNG